jgi:hypothetical protein
MMMRIFYALAALIVLGCHVPVALAAGASVTISSPLDGAKFRPRTEIDVVYEATLGPNGNHVHLYVDSGKAVVLQELKGSYRVGTLVEGAHEICINVVNKAHTPIGAQACVTVSVQ